MTRQWETLKEYDEIKYEFFEGIAKVTINRPEVRNAFTPKTVAEMIDAFTRARDDQNVSVIILTGEGDKAFCSVEIKRNVDMVVMLVKTKFLV